MDTFKEKSLAIAAQKNTDTRLSFVSHAQTSRSADVIHQVQHGQKVVRALYMVTDLVGTDNILVQSVRADAVVMMQSLSALLVKDTQYHKDLLLKACNGLCVIQSSFDILYQYHNMSDMNYQIVSAELSKMSIALQSLFEEKGPLGLEGDVILDTAFFEIEQVISIDKADEIEISPADISVQKVQVSETMNTLDVAAIQAKNTPRVSSAVTPQKKIEVKTVSAKDKRHYNILGILKQKRNASITEICALFKDCSSKTIQRDLAELINQKKVVKRGDRRWSTYNLR